MNGGLTTVTPAANAYTVVSGTFGSDADGGAVGHVPYQLHKQATLAVLDDTIPPNLSAWTLASPPIDADVPWAAPRWWFFAAPNLRGPTEIVRSRFLGPIRMSNLASSNAEKGVRIERRTAPGVWEDVTAQYAPTISAAVPDASLSRDLLLNPLCGQVIRPGTLRIIRNSDGPAPLRASRLRSRYSGATLGDPAVNTAGDDAEVASFAHYLRVGCGPADIAGSGQTIGADGSVSADDIILFNNWFFAADPRADIAGSGQTLGADGNITADDQIVFVNYYFRCVFDANTGVTTYSTEDCPPGLLGGEAQAQSGSGGATSVLAAQIAAAMAEETDPVALTAWSNFLQAVVNAEVGGDR